MSDERAIRLLEEIRDLQREQLAEYRRVTARSLTVQESSAAKQEQFGRTYRRVLLSGGLLIAALMGLLLIVLVRWAPILFR